MCICVYEEYIIIMHIKEKQATGKKFDLVSCLRFSFEERTLNHGRRQILYQGYLKLTKTHLVLGENWELVECLINKLRTRINSTTSI